MTCLKGFALQHARWFCHQERLRAPASRRSLHTCYQRIDRTLIDERVDTLHTACRESTVRIDSPGVA